jgi:predicted negative regulator of RcsB-dependent stress response
MAPIVFPDASDPVAGDRDAMVQEIDGDAALSAGDTPQARRCWLAALERLRALGQPRDAARVASKLAALEEQSGEVDAACMHYAQAADFYKLAGNAHRVPMCLNNLAMLRKSAGDLEAAAATLTRALEEASRCHGPSNAETALIATNLGAVLCECGDLSGAEQRHLQALGIREMLFGATHPEVGLSLGHLGVIWQMQGDDAKARSFYSAALAILDEYPDLHRAEREILRENLAGL